MIDGYATPEGQHAISTPTETVAAALLALTLLSCYFPARRAAQIDPNVACARNRKNLRF